MPAQQTDSAVEANKYEDMIDGRTFATTVSQRSRIPPIRIVNMSRLCVLSVAFLSVLAGCTKTQPVEKTVKAPVIPDDQQAVQALEAAGATLRKNDDSLVTEVNLRDTDIEDDILKEIAKLKYVTSLLLNNTAITDNGLAHLKTLESPLKNLDLRGCAIGDSGLQHLSNLVSLKAIRLNGKKATVSDNGLAALSTLTNLKVLALDGLWVSEIGLEKLQQLQALEELYLKSTTISDDAIKLFANHPKLKKIRLAFNQISDDGLAALADVKQLEELDLSENAELSNAGMVSVGRLKTLKKLNLWRLAIGNEGIQHLANLTNLEWLNLDNTQLSDAGLTALKDMKKLKFLHLGSTAVTTDGLPALYNLKQLQDLKLTRVTVDVTELKKRLPNTKIQTEYVEGQ